VSRATSPTRKAAQTDHPAGESPCWRRQLFPVTADAGQHEVNVLAINPCDWSHIIGELSYQRTLLGRPGLTPLARAA
jgi:hypothetical protein